MLPLRKYQLPAFLAPEVSQAQYERWLSRRAVAHVRRDRRGGKKTATAEGYKRAIHRAVEVSDGVDAYTGEKLDWSLISRYNNREAKRGGGTYRKRFALLPSVDHLRGERGSTDFVICGWRTNDAKSDLSYAEFRELCKKVLTADGIRRW